MTHDSFAVWHCGQLEFESYTCRIETANHQKHYFVSLDSWEAALQEQLPRQGFRNMTQASQQQNEPLICFRKPKQATILSYIPMNGTDEPRRPKLPSQTQSASREKPDLPARPLYVAGIGRCSAARSLVVRLRPLTEMPNFLCVKEIRKGIAPSDQR